MFDALQTDPVALVIPPIAVLIAGIVLAIVALVAGYLGLPAYRENRRQLPDMWYGAALALLVAVVAFFAYSRMVANESEGFAIYWYGILITVGIAIGAIWAGREVVRRGGDEDTFYNGLLLVVISGYVFARLWYVLQEVIAGRGAQYDSFAAIIDLRAGGANILGGFIGAALVGLWYMRRKRVNFWIYADVAGPALLVAQGIGRWGNFINQELYGPPTDLPWGILIDPANRIAPYNDLTQYPVGTRFHPTFLYESLWLLAGFVLLVYLNRRFRDRWKYGTLFGLFLIWWGVGRTWIEFFRPDQPSFGNSPITYSMVLAFLIAVAGVVVILARYNKLPENPRSARRQRRKSRMRKPKPRRDQKK